MATHPMENLFYLVFALTAAVLVITTAVLFFVFRHMRKKLIAGCGGLAKALGAEMQFRLVPFGVTFSRIRGNPEHDCRFIAQNKNRPSRLIVRIQSRIPVFVTFRRKTLFDRISLRLGIVRERNSGNPRFDDLIFTECEVRNTGRIFPAGDRLPDILGWFESDRSLKSVSFGNDSVSAEFTGLKPDEIQPEYVISCIAALNRLARGLSPLPGTPVAPSLSPQIVFNLFVIPLFILCIGGLALIVAALEYYPPIETPFALFGSILLSYALPAWILFIAFVFFRIRNRFDAHRIITSVFFLSIPAFILVVIGAFLISNGYRDESPAETHIVKVVSKHRQKSTYSLAFRSWKDGTTVIRVNVPRELHFAVRKGDRLAVMVRRGYHEVSWFVSAEPVPGNGHSKPSDASRKPL